MGGNILSRKPFEKSQKNRKIPHANEKKLYRIIQSLGTSRGWKSDFISNEHLAPASACFKWLPYLPEATKCPFVVTNLNDHPIMLVLVWQTIFVFKNTKDHKNVKNLDNVH